jgi:hypothetical protein
MLQKIPEKQGVPIAELPVQEEPINLFGVLQGSLTIGGDIVASVDEIWDAEE